MQKLKLTNSHINEGGAVLISNALGCNCSITYLNLRGNQIGDEGTKAIANSLLFNSTLTRLNLCVEKMISEMVEQNPLLNY
uniref:Uncharacterized protein n=1 Tax=Arcella intermedia TaxID=1963864 RepID=A0A6B2LVH6_9EUKA